MQLDEPLLRPHQVADQLAIAESTLATWRCREPQRLPYIRVGGAVRYRPSDLDAFIERNLQAA